MSQPLLAVDAPSLLYRAFHALPKSIAGPDGTPVNALLGTANIVLRAVAEHSPRAVVLCFGVDAASYRVELYPPYHAERPDVPHELAPQFVDAPIFFAAFGWYSEGHGELEADDLLHSFADEEAEAGGRALILTGDRDLYQCASELVSVLYVRTGQKGPEPVGPEEVRRRYGVAPELVPDFIALRGDPSDGIPGAKGIGEKTAAEILRRHGSLEAALEHAIERPGERGVLREAGEELLSFKRIASLRRVEVERPPDRATDFARAAAAARERGMNRLAERMERNAAGDE